MWATVVALTVLAGACSVYLTNAYYQVRRDTGWRSFCDVSSRLSCDAVTASDFSAVAGIPVAWLATVFYLAVAWVAWRVLRGKRIAILRSPALALVVAGGVASAISIMLAIVSGLVIGAFCPLCLVLYACNAALLAIGVVVMRRRGESLGRAVVTQWASIGRNRGRAILAGVFGTMLLGAPLVVRSLRPEVNPARLTDLCAYVESKRVSGDRSETKLVLYTDYQCPYCKKADVALAVVRAADGFTVKTRHYPLDQACNPKLRRTIHEGACQQAAAVVCAEGLGDELGRLIFESGAKGSAPLTRLAVGLGMEAGKFEACLGSQRTAASLAADIEAAQKDEVRGTPTLFVDGRRVQGPLDVAAIKCMAPPL